MTQPDPPDHQPTTVCPECGGPSREIVYGLPGGKMIDDARAGRVHLGGCCIFPDSPDRACTVCDHQWQSPRFRQSFSDLLDLT